jgi:hypothetical protein
VSVIPSGLSQTGPALTSDAWIDTISGLKALTGHNGNKLIEPSQRDTAPRPTRPQAKASRNDVAPRQRSHAVVTFVERVTERSILVNWCDSTSCHYADQLWTKRLARHAGHCALTGKPITRGDAIYAPSTRVSHPPVNERAMIHAASVEG